MRNKRIVLNEGQQYVSDEAVNWYYNSSDTLFQIDGEAGTGKSVVLNDIVKRLGLKDGEILAMAYTGQAAIVMRTKGLMNACTCHSGLFEPVLQNKIDPQTGRVMMDPQFNLPLTKWVFIPRDFTNTKIKLIIIDEAYTVPKSFRKHIERTGIKTIVAGDAGQLPPVNDEPAYLTSGKIYHLSQLMRQAESSPLIYIAHRVRRGLPIAYGQYGCDVFVMFDDEINNDLLSRANMVLCCKNETRTTLIDRIRHDILGKYTDYPSYGERLICRKNNWNINLDGISLANGLVGSVSRPPTVEDFNGKELVLDFKPDLLYRSFENLRVNYRFLNASYKDKNNIRNNPYEFGELFEYAYASTVHLSQGSEYPCGVYYEEYMGPYIQNNLNYTAVTRFRNQMIYLKHKPKYWGIKN